MPPRTRATPHERALAWWKERVDTERYVVPRSESPSQAVTRVLRAERLVLEVANRAPRGAALSKHVSHAAVHSAPSSLLLDARRVTTRTI